MGYRQISFPCQYCFTRSVRSLNYATEPEEHRTSVLNSLRRLGHQVVQTRAKRQSRRVLRFFVRVTQACVYNYVFLFALKALNCLLNPAVVGSNREFHATPFRCPYSPRVQLHEPTSVRTLQIPNAAERVRTHVNTDTLVEMDLIALLLRLLCLQQVERPEFPTREDNRIMRYKSGHHHHHHHHHHHYHQAIIQY